MTRTTYVFLLILNILPCLLLAQFTREKVVSRDLCKMRYNAALDLNNDGHLDAITSGEGGVIWYAGDGEGNFGAQRMIYYSGGIIVQYEMGDIDGDGDYDAVIFDLAFDEVYIVKNNGTGDFTEITTLYETEEYIPSVLIGDMNNNGNQDIVIGTRSTEEGYRLQLFENEGGGVFAEPEVVYEFVTELNDNSIKLADINEDDLLDIVVIDPENIAWLESDGTGNFNYFLIDNSQYSIVTSLTVEDIDNDGNLDIISTKFGGFTVYMNDGLGNFTIIWYGELTGGIDSIRGIFAEDINGDGYCELFYNSFWSDQVGYILSDGTGGYDSHVILNTDSNEGYGVLLTDFNEDDISDLYYVCFKSIRIAEGTEEGIFLDYQDIYVKDPTITTGLKDMDIDNDGDLDLIISYRDYTNESGKKILWYENIDDEFRIQHFIDNNSNGVGQMKVADVDNDGLDDIVITTGHGRLLQVYYNQGNANFSEPVTFTDNAKVLLHLADFNNDGFLDAIHLGGSGFSNIFLSLNDGTGAFGEAIFVASFSAIYDLKSADMNNDGNEDIIYVDRNDSEVGYLPGDSNGNFSAPVIITNEQFGPINIELGYLDNNETIDAVIVSIDYDEMIVYLNSDAGTVFTETSLEVNSPPGKSRLIDYDYDGDLDVFCTLSSHEVNLFDNNGEAIFTKNEDMTFSMNTGTSILLLADLNEDNGFDIIGGTGFNEECKTWIHFNENGIEPSILSSIDSISCNDNNTPLNADDDILEFSMLVNSEFLSDTYSVSANGLIIEPNMASYGDNVNFSFPAGTAGTGDIEITITDTENPDYEQIVVLSNSVHCSLNTSISVVVEEVTCQDNETPNNPLDDIVAFSLHALGNGIGEEYALQSDNYAITPEIGVYQTSSDFTFESGSAGEGNINLIVIDGNNSEVFTEIIIEDPGVCSSASSINAMLTEVTCDNNETPNDPLDDIISFTLQATGNGNGGGYNLHSNDYDIFPEMGTYDSSLEFTLEAGSAGGGNTELIVIDGSNSSVLTGIIIEDPGVCSFSSSISISIGDIACIDNETPNDPLDDIISFTLQAMGNGNGEEYTLHTEDYTISPNMGIYDTPLQYTLESGSAGSGDIPLTVTDVSNPEASEIIILTDTGVCSALPSIDTVIEDINCHDNNTPNNPLDDFMSFIVEADINGMGQEYILQSEDYTVTPTLGTYGVSTVFTLESGSAGHGNVELMIIDEDNPEIFLEIIIDDTGVCSFASNINATIEEIACQDNETSNNPLDDIIYFRVQATSNGIGQEFTLQTQDYIVTPASGNYGILSEFTLEPGSAGNGDVELLLTDEGNPEASTEIILTDTGSCSLVNVNNIVDNNFLLYPNPTEGLLYIDVKNKDVYSLTVYNALQQAVFQDGFEQEQTYLDLSKLSSGVYIISLEDSRGKIFTQKFTIF